MSTSSEVLFLVCAFIAIIGAVGTIVSQNPLRAAVSLLVHIVALAGLYLTLHAQLLAAIQLLVYAGAVVVLFVFVIMLIGPSATLVHDPKGLVIRAISVALMVLLTSAVAFSLVEYSLPKVKVPLCLPGSDPGCVMFGGVGGLGRALYGGAALPFELVSVLLTVAIVGAVAVARGRTAHEKATAAAVQTQVAPEAAVVAPQADNQEQVVNGAATPP